ncbi:MAG: hypothetical protein HY537_18845 [Deltaproteobacteria bacterium]|nr:hypothetical protein [Deltaproteobacteria bacterium]
MVRTATLQFAANSATAQDSIEPLLEAFLKEPFSIEHGFSNLTPSEVAALLESTSEQEQQQGNVTPEQTADPAMAQSFSTSKDLFCRILMQMDCDGLDFLTSETLSDLRQREQRTLFIAEAVDIKLDEPHAESAAESSLQQLGLAEATPELAADGALDPVQLSALHPQQEHPSGEAQTSSLTESLKPFFDKLGSPNANESLRAADFLYTLGIKRSVPVSEEMLRRLVELNILFAIEAESIFKLKPALLKFWSDRRNNILSILNLEAKTFELHPALQTGLEDLVSLHSGWLFEGNLPYHNIINSLRYMMAFHDGIKFIPSILESGTLVFFFGQDASFNGLCLKNILNANGLDSTQNIELFFRLARSHKLRSRTLSAGHPFTTEFLEHVFNDAERIFVLFNQLILPG